MSSSAFITRVCPLAGLLLALVLLLAPSNGFAQSSVGQALNTATGRSIADAIEQNQNGLIENEVLGAPNKDGIAGGGALGVTAFPTGRLRSADHDGLKSNGSVSADFTNEHFSWTTQEASAFVNVVTTVPGTVLGGQLKLSGFVGGNWLSLDLKSNSNFTLGPDQFGSARNESVLLGGTALWASKGTYALATIVGMVGESTLNDSIDDCGLSGPAHPFSDCEFHRYKFNTVSFIGTLTGGRVFQLSGSPSGPMLDLRGSVSYTQSNGDSFLNDHFGLPDHDRQKYTFSTWTVTTAATLFTNISLQNSGLLRPYLQGYLRQELDYTNNLDVVISGGFPRGVVSYDQSHLYGGVDLGLTYISGNMTIGGAIYFDGSGDERSLGGRLGASWKLN